MITVMKLHPFWASFIRRLLVFTACTLIITGISIWTLLDTPEHYLYSDRDWDSASYTPEHDPDLGTVLLDAHSHSILSNGGLTLRQTILFHLSSGFNAMVLTDHNTIEGWEEIRRIAREEFAGRFLVLAGVEWTTDRGHFNLVFPPRVTPADCAGLIPERSFLDRPSDRALRDKFRRVHELGGIIVVNHVQGSRKLCKNYCPLEKLVEWGADAVEIVNEEEYDGESYDYCKSHNLGMVAGTDMHYPGKVYGWTQLNVKGFSEDAVFQALKDKKTNIVFNPAGSPYLARHRENPVYPLLAPFESLGRLILDLYESAHYVRSFLFFYGYVFGIFFLAEAVRFLTGKFGKKTGERAPRS
jgi:hypothetical protein